MEDIRMKDERNENGSGFLIVEINVEGTWTELTRTWFWKEKPSKVYVRHDDVKEIAVSQFTDNRSTWTKKQYQNKEAFNGHFNLTGITRKEAPLKKKGDC